MAQNLLALWNIALASVGERSLASTSTSTENVESLRLLNEVWTRGRGAVSYVLEQGLWSFAVARSAPTVTTSTAAFGHAFSFALPTDFVRLVEISSTADMRDPLLRYEFETTKIYADSSIVYLRYVSSSTAFGGDLARWPDSFALYAGHWLGTQVAPRMRNEIDHELLGKRTSELLASARFKDMARGKRPWPPLSPGSVDHEYIDFIIDMMALRRST